MHILLLNSYPFRHVIFKKFHTSSSVFKSCLKPMNRAAAPTAHGSRFKLSTCHVAEQHLLLFCLTNKFLVESVTFSHGGWCALLYHALYFCTVLCCTVLYCTVLYCTHRELWGVAGAGRGAEGEVLQAGELLNGRVSLHMSCNN